MPPGRHAATFRPEMGGGVIPEMGEERNQERRGIGLGIAGGRESGGDGGRVEGRGLSWDLWISSEVLGDHWDNVQTEWDFVEISLVYLYDSSPLAIH